MFSVPYKYPLHAIVSCMPLAMVSVPFTVTSVVVPARPTD